MLAGVYVQSFDRSPSAAHALSLKDKRAIHYVWILAMLTAVATSVAAFVLTLRTRGLRLKWLWAIGSLVGLTGFQLNWTTGEWGMWLFSFHLFGAGAVQNGPLLPWIMTFAIPVVAIVFLILRALRRLPIRRADPDQLASGTP